MGFFDKIGKKASEAYKITADKTEKVATETRMRLKMSDLKSQINSIYGEIGKKVYENHLCNNNECCKNGLEEKCAKIDELSNEINNLEKQCLELRSMKKCKKCQTEIDKMAKYCYNCGEKQEEQQNDNIQEIEIPNNESDENIAKTVEIESNVNTEVETESDIINENEDNQQNEEKDSEAPEYNQQNEQDNETQN